MHGPHRFTETRCAEPGPAEAPWSYASRAEQVRARRLELEHAKLVRHVALIERHAAMPMADGSSDRWGHARRLLTADEQRVDASDVRSFFPLSTKYFLYLCWLINNAGPGGSGGCGRAGLTVVCAVTRGEILREEKLCHAHTLSAMRPSAAITLSIYLIEVCRQIEDAQVHRNVQPVSSAGAPPRPVRDGSTPESMPACANAPTSLQRHCPQRSNEARGSPVTVLSPVRGALQLGGEGAHLLAWQRGEI